MLRSSLLLGVAVSVALAQTPCENLKAPVDAVFTAAETVAAGPYRSPNPSPALGGRGGPAPLLPAHCRIAATLKPSADSEIKMELWMPSTGWNGKFEMVGNGGWAGIISFPAMATALREGYATASTDTGHPAGNNGMFALGHPEKLVDFGWRAVHETVRQSKLLIAAFYGGNPKYSYWNGCSTGGRQALVEAAKFPEDFDGVVAGAPANPLIHLHAGDVERYLRLMKNPQGALSAAKVDTLHKAVLAACDGLDGVKDGLIDNPRACHFDPATLLCKGADSDACLTAAQVETVKINFADIRNNKGQLVWTGYEPGGEAGYRTLQNIPTQVPNFQWDSIRIVGHQDANYAAQQFDLERDVELSDKAGIDVLTFDLSAFHKHGGKLLLFHGWSDPAIPPGNTVNFYEGVQKQMGGRQDDWMRLFMVPGMGHCGGGLGTDQFNKMAVIERWREDGKAPEQIPAAHVSNGQVDMTRPLCPYPQVAVYKGSGSTNDAANFSCKTR